MTNTKTDALADALAAFPRPVNVAAPVVIGSAVVFRVSRGPANARPTAEAFTASLRSAGTAAVTTFDRGWIVRALPWA